MIRVILVVSIVAVNLMKDYNWNVVVESRPVHLILVHKVVGGSLVGRLDHSRNVVRRTQ